MSARYQLSKRKHFVGVAVLLFLQFTTGGTTTTSSSPDTTYSSRSRSQTVSNSSTTISPDISSNSVITSRDTSYNSMATSTESLHSSMSNTSDSTITTSPDISFSSMITSPLPSYSIMSNSHVTSDSSLPTSSDIYFSNVITSPVTTYSSTMEISDTLHNSMPNSHETSDSSTTTSHDISISSMITTAVTSCCSISNHHGMFESGIIPSSGTSYSSKTTSPEISLSSTTTSFDTSVNSTTTNHGTSVSSTTIHLHTSVGSTTTRSATSVSITTTIPNTSVSSTTTTADSWVSIITTRPDTSVSRTPTRIDTSVSSTTISHDTLFTSTTTNPKPSDSSTTTSIDVSNNSTTTSPHTSVTSTKTNPDTSGSSTTTSIDTSYSNTTTSPHTSVTSTTTNPDTSFSSMITSHYTSVSSTTTSPDTSLNSSTTSPYTSFNSSTTSPYTSVNSTTTSADSWVNSTTTIPYTSNSTSTTRHVSSFSSTPDYQFSSTTSDITKIATVTRVFVVDGFVNASSDDCATIGEGFQFRFSTYFELYSRFVFIYWTRSDNRQRVTYIIGSDSYCYVQVWPMIDYRKYSINCTSTGGMYILNINEVTGDDIGHNWTVSSYTTFISNSMYVKHCGSEDKVNTTSQECASLGERFRLRATYDFHTDEADINRIEWNRSDNSNYTNIYYSMYDCSVKVDPDYDMIKYSFYCNSSENVYFLELKNVTYDDLDANWTVTTWFDVELEPITVALCDCPGLYFGDNCTQECDCNGESCNATTGVCLSGCGKPSDIVNGHVNYNGTITSSTATYTCDVGHYLIGTNRITCGQNGTWIGDIPKCQLVDCGEPTKVAYALVSHTVTTYNATATYTCAIGYNMTGDGTITCGEDGTWDGDKPVCRIIDCVKPSDIENGHVNYNGTITSSTATYTYDVDCGLPWNIMDGRYTLVGSTEYSSVALYNCNLGFMLNNTNNRKRCEPDGTWQGEIGTCVRVECSSLSLPNNALVAYSGNNKTATFSCNSGFRLIGRDKLFCLSTGNWSETVPKCEKVEAETKYCQTDKDSRGTLWNKTSQEQIVTSPCPEGQEGTISRQCNKTGEWKLPRYTCVKREISEAESKIDVIESSNITEAVKVEIVSDVLDTLSNSTTATVSSVSAGMGDGEIEKVTSILERVASISQDIVVTEKQSEDFIGTTSNLLNQQNSGSFRSLEENKVQNGTSPGGADRVLGLVGNFAKAIAKSLDQLNGSKTIQTDNMVVTVSKLDENEDIQFPLKSLYSSDMNSSTSAKVPHSGLKGIGSYSGIFYSNLSGLLSPRIHDKGSDDEGNFEINAAIIDMQLLNTTGTPPHFKINLNFDNFQSGNYETKCCFWNYSRRSWDTFGCKLDTDKTNSSITVCTCNHTTNFAILMNPYKTQNVDSKVLDYISLVGCSISMVCLIVTIVMHAALWRYLKSDRAIILINLSIALILSYATFVFGADKTDNKVVCTTVAVALHYIYLVVFFLMLSEGIEIFITVVYVFVMKSRLRRLLLLSWGFPAIIVGTSVAVTQSDGYGSEEYCWLSVHSGLIWAFVGPALAIILANFVQLFIVIKAMFKVRTLKERSRVEKVKTGVRCLCVLLPLTGGTWVIGVFYVNENLAWIQYTFAILNGLQGVFILLFHCITNSQIKIAISRRIKLYRASTAYTRSSNNPTPRSSATTGLSSHRHERATDSYNDSRDLIEDSFQSFDRHMHQWKEDSRGHTTSYL